MIKVAVNRLEIRYRKYVPSFPNLYLNIDDKQAFLKDENSYLRSFVMANADLTYRRAIKTRHRVGIAYIMEKVKDTVVSLNPKYFESGRKSKHIPEVNYRRS